MRVQAASSRRGSHAREHEIYVITGPSGSGKTTVARLLAGHFTRGVHIEGDFFRRSSSRDATR